MLCSIVNDDRGDEAGICKSVHVAIISGESTLRASASSFTLNLATLKVILFNDLIKIYVFFFILLLCVELLVTKLKMSDDSDLKLTLHKVVSYAVLRMESASDANIRRCIFQEYKEWLGTSIDDWVLALPNDWGRSDVNFH